MADPCRQCHPKCISVDNKPPQAPELPKADCDFIPVNKSWQSRLALRVKCYLLGFLKSPPGNLMISSFSCFSFRDMFLKYPMADPMMLS